MLAAVVLFSCLISWLLVSKPEYKHYKRYDRSIFLLQKSLQSRSQECSHCDTKRMFTDGARKSIDNRKAACSGRRQRGRREREEKHDVESPSSLMTLVYWWRLLSGSAPPWLTEPLLVPTSTGVQAHKGSGSTEECCRKEVMWANRKQMFLLSAQPHFLLSTTCEGTSKEAEQENDSASHKTTSFIRLVTKTTEVGFKFLDPGTWLCQYFQFCPWCNNKRYL